MDKREVILRNEVCANCIWEESRHLVNTPFEQVFNAMDENGKRLCLELLEYMAKNEVKCSKSYLGPNEEFLFKGKWISKEQLFQNFL